MYLKDSAPYISLLNDIKWFPNYKWASLDVPALYSNILHHLGIPAGDGYLYIDPHIPTSQKEFIINGIEFNMFKFESNLYLQTRGSAIGTRFASRYANLFMGQFEKLYIQNPQPWSTNIILCKRYIDDLFFIWVAEFNNFTNHLNQNNYGISRSGKTSSNIVEYLDIELTTPDDKIITKTNFKKVDTSL